MKSIYILIPVFLMILVCGPSPEAFSQSSTFSYTGAVQTYTVPAGVTSIGVDARGAIGGAYSITRGGYGGRVQCTMNVTPLTVYYIYVGGQGSVGLGGFNGGGATSTFGAASSGGGGGGTDMRTVAGPPTITNRPVVAGGGGGGTVNYFTANYDRGGAGGGLTGEQGYTDNVHVLSPTQYGGEGGTPAGGGLGGTQPGYTAGFSGTVGVGGTGATGTYGTGGGGGYYGGGGGSWDGGGGGSSYTDPSMVTAVIHTQGYNTTGNGLLIINPLCSTPVGGAITGPGNVCVGSNIPLTDPTGSVGGVWTSTNTGIATINSSSGIVTGISAGTAIISYSIVLSCGSAFAASVVTVNPVPGAILGPLNVCAGSSVGLTDATSGGSWSSITTIVATATPTSGFVYGVSAGTSAIFYTLPTGCSSSVIMLVNLPPAPVTGPSSVCMGSTIIESDAASGGNWSSSNTSVATINTGSGLVTPVSPGPVTVTYANGCGTAATTTIMVNPLPLPISGLTSLCIAVTTTLRDATRGGAWSSTITSVATVGSSSGVVTGVSGGLVTISYTLPTSCAVAGVVTVIPPLAPITGPHSVCVGLTAVLGGLPTGGSWVSGTPGNAIIGPASGVVTGVSMGTSLITYTTGVGCSATLEMTVNPRAPILGTDSVCVGTSGFLTNIVGGGVWSSSNPTIATTRSDSGRVTGIIPGTVTITYLLPTGCQSSVPYQVISFPGSISGITKACTGTTTALVNTTPTGGLWSSKNNSVATVVPATGVVTGVSADTVTVNYTILPGCAVGTLVTINPLPALIAGPLYVCPYTIDSLKDVTPGGLWSSGSVSLATVVDTSGVVTTLAGGDPVISYTLPTGCYRTKTLSIFAPPAPIVGYNPYTNTLYVTNTSIAYVSYQWYDSLVGEIPGATSPTLAGRFNEYYYVVVTDTNGCKGASVFYHYNIGETLVKNTPAASEIKIYPNPVSGILNIVSQVNVRAVISSVDGRRELEQEHAKVIDVSRLADGVYLIQLYNDSGALVLIQKITKE